MDNCVHSAPAGWYSVEVGMSLFMASYYIEVQAPAKKPSPSSKTAHLMLNWVTKNQLYSAVKGYYWLWIADYLFRYLNLCKCTEVEITPPHLNVLIFWICFQSFACCFADCQENSLDKSMLDYLHLFSILTELICFTYHAIFECTVDKETSQWAWSFESPLCSCETKLLSQCVRRKGFHLCVCLDRSHWNVGQRPV